MPQPAPPMTFTHLISLFTNQLTISIHTILASRGLYPPNTFIKARAYNLPVQQSRHPGVCAWINDAVAAVEAELLKGTVARIALVIFETTWESKSGKSSRVGTLSVDSEAKNGGQIPAESSHTARALERYVWDVSRFPSIPKSEHNTPFIRSSEPADPDDRPVTPDVEIVPSAEELSLDERRVQFQERLKQLHSDMHEQFRALLSRLSTISTRLASIANSTECTFTLCLELKEASDPPIGHPQPWIASEKRLQRRIIQPDEGEAIANEKLKEEQEERDKGERRPTEKGKDLGGIKVTPVRTVDQGEMVFEMWIEEATAKFPA